MIEGAIIAGVCVALSFIPLNTANASFDISLGLIPLLVYALRRGLVPGMAAGLVWGILMIVLGRAWVLSLPQVILEYPVAFAIGAFGGVFSGRLKKCLSLEGNSGLIVTVVLAAIVSATARWFIHFIAGLIFWVSYLPDVINLYWFEFTVTPYQFNAIANGASAAVNAIVLAVVLAILVRSVKPMFKT